MLESGANTARVEETMHRLGTALGAAWLEILVTPTAILVSIHTVNEHRTRLQHIVTTGVNLDRIAAITAVSREATAGHLDRAAVRAALERSAVRPRLYGTGTTILSVALASFALAAGMGTVAALARSRARVLAPARRAGAVLPQA